MRSAVLQCHPLRESYNEALLDRTLAGLRAGGSDPEVFRLAEASGPTGSDLDGVELVAFVHPIWWGGHPAPLLGWMQNQLGPWIDGDAPMASSPLRTVRQLLSVCSHGSSHLINRLQGEPARKLMDRTVVGLCAPNAGHQWTALYKLDRLDPSNLDEFLELAEGDARRLAEGLTSAVGAS